MKKTKTSRSWIRVIAISLVLVACVMLGSWLVVLSRAATPFIVSEPESGIVKAPVTSVSDTAASGSKAIKFGSTPQAATGKFMLVVMPDTQITTWKYQPEFLQMTKWIADNASKSNIKFVIHVGDVQEYPAHLEDFTNARAGMNQLDGKVPYVVAIGNHDFDVWSTQHYDGIAVNRSVSIFNTYFPVSKFKTWPSFSSSYPTGTNDNSFHTFSAGGTDWGILTLKYDPTPNELSWANSVVAANPSRRIIINTHDYLYGSGGRTPAGTQIWDGLAKKYKNIEFVFAGHINPGQRRVDKGVNGNNVYQMLSDYQNYDEKEPNLYLRPITFDPAAGTVTVKTYAPPLNKYMTGDADDFVLTGVPFGPVK